MISVNDFRTGLTIEHDNDIWRIIDFQHVKPGKGAAFVRSKLRSLRTGNIQDKTFRSNEKVKPAMIDRHKVQYLYADGEDHIFMDTETYDQITLPADRIEHELKFIKEQMEVSIVQYESEILGIDLPVTVTLEVAETEPGIKGNTASGGSKTATMETGLVVQVPLFIETGDKLVINTEEAEYVSRA